MNAFKLSALAALTATMGFLGGMGNAMADQQLVDQLSQLKLNVKMLDNRAGENGVDCAALGADWASCNRVLFTLSNDGQAIDGKDWVIYFHSPRQTLRVDNDQFKIAHLTGDLYKLEPTAKFSGFPAGKAVEIPVVAEYWQLFRNDFLMPRPATPSRKCWRIPTPKTWTSLWRRSPATSGSAPRTTKTF